MATHLFSRSLLARTNQTLASLIYRSLSSSAVRSPPSSVSCLLLHRLRPLASVSAELRLLLAGSPASRGFSTRATSSSLNDPNPNWSNRPPKETILLDGCDFEHWLVVMEKPEGDPTRDEIIDSYIKTLSMVVGSEEEARMKIYSVSTRCYYAFGALVSEELSYKLKELPRVRWVLPDSYLDVKNKDYGGEPFINGQAVPYDPKYHEEWIRNNARANERNRRNDRPRNFDRSRNFDRRRENMPSRDFQNAPNNSPPPGASGMGPSNQGGMPPNQNYQGGMPPPPPNANYRGGMPPPPPNPNYQGGMPPPPPQNPNYQGGMPPSPGYHGGNVPPRNMGGPPPYNSGGMPPQNMGGMPPYNQGGAPPQHSNMGGMPPPYNNMGGMPPQNNMGGMPPPPNMNQGWNGNAQSYNPSRDPETGPGGNPYSG